MSLIRQGELYFHDARLCYDGWQSCASCHPGDARCDGLNWDLLNDGVGNPKNTKSLLLCFQTPPAMSLGIRETAATAVRAGISHILLTQQPEEVALAIDAYLKSLKPVPSPFLVQGPRSKVQSPEAEVHSSDLATEQGPKSKIEKRKAKVAWVLSSSAKRGQQVFTRTGCAACHPPPLYTDLHAHDVGTRASFDKPNDEFDTPTLIALWRTAPYLHDGSAATIRDVLTARNPHDQHGSTSHLTAQQITDLCTFLLSL